MRECFKLEKQFEGFNRHQADRKLGDFLDVLLPYLRRGDIKEFTSILDWAVYDRAVSGAVRDTFHNPYLFLIGAIQAEVVKRVSELGGDPVYFFFDDQTPKLEFNAAYQFERAKVTVPREMLHLLHGMTFASDQYCYPLQVADLIAWQRHRKELNLPEDLGERKEFKRIRGATKEAWLFPYREDGLIAFCLRMERRLAESGLL